MSVERALVDCAVLSLQDTRLFYPCCKSCFLKIDAEERDVTRLGCSRCGFTCPRDQADYRYRLSLRVIRNKCIFGVTVFGKSLNPFFGIHATGLQRLVENVNGSRFSLLVKAVEDCFIGRHFIFGIKLSATETGPWSGRSSSDGSSSRDAAQFVASQMILPKDWGLTGCTVLRYYQSLCQKATEYEAASDDPSKSFRLPTPTLLLMPDSFPTRSFSHSPLHFPGLISQSLLRSESQDQTLTPTHPWRQSLGLVTSSAEQEEGCSLQNSGDENCRKGNSTTPHPAPRGCLERRDRAGGTTPPPPLEHSLYNSPSFATSPVASVAGNGVCETWCSSSQSGHKCDSLTPKESSARRQPRTPLSCSLAWEDFPFSESLTEFLCEADKCVDVAGETIQNLNAQCCDRITRPKPEIPELAGGSASAGQRNPQVKGSPTQILQDVTNAPTPEGGDGQDLSEQICKSPVKCKNRRETKSIYSNECQRENDEAHLSLLEEESYNCSADLFDSSPLKSMNMETISKEAENVRTAPDACTYSSKSGQQHPLNKAEITPFTPREIKELDFVPPSQSTPVVNRSHRSGRTPCSRRLTSEGRRRRPATHRRHLQQRRLQRTALDSEPVRSCRGDGTDDEGVVAPTPDGNAQLLRKRRRTHNSSRDTSSKWKPEGEGVGSLNQTLSWLGSLPQTGSNGRRAAFEGSLDGSTNHPLDDENQACDWSRDLFSDSV
ncbi:unnamed protein product [Menidia menidia]|uniref:(Atlantic silverside) hypothetical protein n=1 Tax=Menidia menidia TaxID=238744 RepID=A0A8S4A657_9TELE|nr:unnamed protein product [Menidia menidia]